MKDLYVRLQELYDGLVSPRERFDLYQDVLDTGQLDCVREDYQVRIRNYVDLGVLRPGVSTDGLEVA